MPILIVTVLLIVGASPLLYWLRFDFNPMNLRNPKAESVATYLQLEQDQAAGTNDIAALEPTLADGRRSCRQASSAAASGARNDAFHLHPDRAGQETAADQKRSGDARSRSLAGHDQPAADRRG